MQRGEFKHRYWFFADTQISLGIVALFEKIYNGEPILKYRGGCTAPLFQKMYDVKSVSQPDTMPILENNYCMQIIETGFGEQF